jgi:hypothetical protein
MDPVQAAEYIPLVDLDPPSPPRNRGRSTLKGDDDDGLAPATIFHSPSEVKLLAVSPVFSPFKPTFLQWTQHQLLYSPASIILVLLIASAAHWIAVELYTRDVAITQAPAIISTAATLMLIFQNKWRIRYLERRLYGGEEGDYTSLCQVMLVAAIIVPLLAVPLHSYPTIAISDRTADDTLHVDVPFATLSSWSQAVSNLDGFLPYSPAGDIRGFLTSWWTNLTYEDPARLLRTITFSSSKDEEKPEARQDDLIHEYNGVYMPVLPLEPPSAYFRESEVRVRTQMLAVRLNCIHAEIQSQPLAFPTGDSAFSLTVHVRDPESDCTATLTLPGLRISETLRGYLISDLVQLLETESNSQVREFCQRQLTYLLDHPHLTSFAPGWSRLAGEDMTQRHTACRDRLVIAGLSRVFFRDEDIPIASASPSSPMLEAAICETQFMSRETDLRFFRERLTLFRKGSSWDEPVLGELSGAANVSEWTALSTAENARLREAFFATAAATATMLAREDAPSWASAVLEARAAALADVSAKSDGTILLVGRWVQESLFERLAIAAELTLRESIGTRVTPEPAWNDNSTSDGHGPPPFTVVVGQDRPGMRVIRQVQQTRWFFRLTPLALLAALVWATNHSDDFLASIENSLPWQLDSIVAQALLLRHSPIRLENYTIIRGSVNSPGVRIPDKCPKLRIGYWRTHRKVGKSGWRLDSQSSGKHTGFQISMHTSAYP